MKSIRQGALVCSCFCLAAAAQTPAAQPNTASEMSTHDEAATFKSRVNLVLVPVVVRDSKGKAVGTLHKEDFQLFDRGKPQIISRFSMEKSGGQTIQFADTADGNATPKPQGQAAQDVIPNRFVAYLFDDVHFKFGDLVYARDAAGRRIANDLAPTDRAAIFTTSGQTTLDFTDDRDKLHDTLMRLQPRPVARSGLQECPDISYYMADLIVNKNDPSALQAAGLETAACTPGLSAAQAQQLAMATAQRVLSSGEHESRLALSVLKDVVRRMSAAPGQRILVLISPGFLTQTDMSQDKTDIMDKAIHSNIVIGALDARGLYVTGVDASKRGASTALMQRLVSQYERESASAEADVMAELADGTGGTFFQNNNDMDEGLRRTSSAPEFYYLIGFSPQNLKLDGAFHRLKVSLKDPAHLELEARRGYYAPRRLTDAAETAKSEIEEALFSREEMRELPVDLHTQFFKAGDGSATVSVLAHLDVKHFKYRKADGRNNNEVTIVASLFDRNGNYVQGVEKVVSMRLKDDTLEKKVDNGFTIKSSFSVKPGTYLVRLVVRDAEGQSMSAANSAVDIP